MTWIYLMAACWALIAYIAVAAWLASRRPCRHAFTWICTTCGRTHTHHQTTCLHEHFVVACAACGLKAPPRPETEETP